MWASHAVKHNLVCWTKPATQACNGGIAYHCAAALERAKDAVKRERGVVRLREQLNLLDQLNLDLQFGVAVNLAHMYAANQLYREALNAYTQIIKGKTHAQVGRPWKFAYMSSSGGTLKRLRLLRAHACTRGQPAALLSSSLTGASAHVLQSSARRMCGWAELVSQ